MASLGNPRFNQGTILHTGLKKRPSQFILEGHHYPDTNTKHEGNSRQIFLMNIKISIQIKILREKKKETPSFFGMQGWFILKNQIMSPY